MPGHMLEAECKCGFRRNLQPGCLLIVRKSYEIAYTADYGDITTADTETIAAENMHVVENPFLTYSHSGVAGHQREVFGPYLCPNCKAKSLEIGFSGFWDGD